ncbi:MAG: HNH endonuclease [Gemmatimonadaceae bacterium]|nr:HNH endonuclease [Gemmatimonadaceae bacterium]
MSGAPDVKDAGRLVADRDDWTRIVAEKHGPCRSCQSTDRIEFHHVVPRSLRGDDLPANVVPLCQDCHGAWERKTPGWEEIAHAIRASLTPLERQYVVAKKGKRFLDRYYAEGALCPKCRRQASITAEAKPKPEGAASIEGVYIPLGERPKGGEAFATMLALARRELGRDGDSLYYVLVEILHFFLTTPKERAA